MNNHSRRNFLGLTGLGIVSELSSPLLAQNAPTKIKNIALRNPWIYHFKIGELDAWSISDGFMKIRQTLTLMYPEADRTEMEQLLKNHSEPLDHIPLYINILVIKKGNEIALFDAGFGLPERGNRGWLTSGLEQIGITPEQVTHTFLSHAHSDHLAGFTSKGKPTFKNAGFYVTPEEYNYWRSANPDFSQTKRDPKQIPGMVAQAKKHLEILTPQKEFSPVGSSFLDGAITVENGFGHTPGHAVYRIRSGKDELLHTVDLAHHHLLMFEKSNWNIGWDNNLKIAAETRKRIFSQASNKRTRVFGFHLPFPGLGHITAQGQGYRWLPERLIW